jgi:hypothetical protein
MKRKKHNDAERRMTMHHGRATARPRRMQEDATAEVSEDEEPTTERITLDNWAQRLPWTKLASREQPEVGQLGLIIKGKEKDGLGKMAIVLRVHSVKITVGYWCPRDGGPKTSLQEPTSLM